MGKKTTEKDPKPTKEDLKEMKEAIEAISADDCARKMKAQLDHIFDDEAIESAICVVKLKTIDEEMIGSKGHFYDLAKMLAGILREYKKKIMVDLD